MDYLIVHMTWILIYGLITLTTLAFQNGFLIFQANKTPATSGFLTSNFQIRFIAIMALCINCNIAIRANQQFNYNALSMGPDMISIIEEWIAREVTEEDCICQECINLLIIELDNRTEGNSNAQQQLGHQSVCVSCGISVSRRTGRHSRLLLDGHPVQAYIANNIHPRQIPVNARACNACWQRAYYHSMQEQAEPSRDVLVEPVESGSSSMAAEPVSATSSEFAIEDRNVTENRNIVIDGYSRTPDTGNHCFVPECMNPERLRVPLYLKKKILTDLKLYVTPNARVCQEHVSFYDWDFIEEFQFTEHFTITHIGEMLDLLRRQSLNTINFENMDDSICRYWTGLSVLNFLAILSCINQLAVSCRKPKLALGLYLMKIRTGEPIRRLASLLCISNSLACSYMKKARNCLKDFYVPLHIGINHISRLSLSSRNLLIPQGLFGTAENNLIIICDGTYIYLQKSSNYLFQKKSYSWHKFANLVKPFLLVTTDGHILDIFGPYAATTSDATIMKLLFQTENSPLRQYFMRNDVFHSLPL